MPFDPFFSSTNKKRYVAVEGADELYARIKAMSYEERKKEMNSWKGRDPTPAERMVRRKIAFDLQQKRRAKIHLKGEKQIVKAIEEYKAGKRDRIIIHRGYNSAPGAGGRTTSHAHGSK